MKKLILIITAVAISQITVSAQGCLPEGITFTTQDEIDNFHTNYPGCTEIEGSVTIYDSYSGSITNLNGLSVVASIGGAFVIVYTSALTSLSGLENLASIGCGFWIDENDSLTSLAGLEGVTSIGGDLSITSNIALSSLRGLENLTSIGVTFNIFNNDALTSLDGLNNIDAGSIQDLYIWDNTSLSTCEVQSVCNYLATPGGYITIGYNAPGCNSPAEVEAACQVGIESIPEINTFNMYPNPSSTSITIETSSVPPTSQLSILNLNGQQLIHRSLTQQKTVVDISNLPCGVHIIKLQSDKGLVMKKLAKQ
jgi:hypothetical protein